MFHQQKINDLYVKFIWVSSFLPSEDSGFGHRTSVFPKACLSKVMGTLSDREAPGLYSEVVVVGCTHIITGRYVHSSAKDDIGVGPLQPPMVRE